MAVEVLDLKKDAAEYAQRGVPRDIEGMSNEIRELSEAEMDAVSGGVFTEVHHNPQYKEPTVLLDDGLNIQTTGIGHSNVGYDSPFTPIPA